MMNYGMRAGGWLLMMSILFDKTEILFLNNHFHFIFAEKKSTKVMNVPRPNFSSNIVGLLNSKLKSFPTSNLLKLISRFFKYFWFTNKVSRNIKKKYFVHSKLSFLVGTQSFSLEWEIWEVFIAILSDNWFTLIKSADFLWHKFHVFGH